MTTLINDCLTTTNCLSLRRFKGFLAPEYDIVPPKVRLINPHTELEVLMRLTPAKVRQKRNCSSSGLDVQQFPQFLVLLPSEQLTLFPQNEAYSNESLYFDASPSTLEFFS